MKLANNRDISESLQKTLNTKNLFDLYVENWTKEKRDEFRANFSVDGENPEKFVAFPENPETYFVPRNEPYAVSIPCKLIESCSDYNRTNQIDFHSCVKNLEKYGNKFFCEGADEGGNPIQIWYDSRHGVFRTTRGNHRTIMKLLTSGKDATIEGYIKAHDVSATDDEMFMKEATCFDSDNQQKGQTKGSLFKGKLFNAISNPDAPQWPVELYDYLNSLPTPIGIAETNKNAHIQIDGFSAINKKMIEVSDDTNLVDKYEKLTIVLNTLVDHAIPTNSKSGQRDGTLKADCIEHFMMFRAKFSKVIGQVDKANNIDSFPQFVHYIFNQRNALTGGLLDNLTMQTLTQNSSQIRNFGWYVANICTLYNEFVKVKKLKKGDQNKDAHDSMVISTGLVSWKDFKDEIPFSFQKAVEGQLSDIYR